MVRRRCAPPRWRAPRVAALLPRAPASTPPAPRPRRPPSDARASGWRHGCVWQRLIEALAAFFGCLAVMAHAPGLFGCLHMPSTLPSTATALHSAPALPACTALHAQQHTGCISVADLTAITDCAAMNDGYRTQCLLIPADTPSEGDHTPFEGGPRPPRHTSGTHF